MFITTIFRNAYYNKRTNELEFGAGEYHLASSAKHEADIADPNRDYIGVAKLTKTTHYKVNEIICNSKES
jgi:hypothetical protein